MAKRESIFERNLVAKLMDIYPNAVILKTDPTYIQGFPDRLALLGNNWFAFETKRTATSPHRPNQDYYVDLLRNMSYANFVYPENEEEFLYEIQRTFRPPRTSRFFRG